ncbi:hypothetical protein [Alistipes sp.]|uniref:hypothetical protein n=1 Tax=Alistipes sp. TaxID=1872444 RepID=UPI003AEFD8B6
MDNKLPSGGRLLTSLLFFALSATFALLLLLAALLVWLSDVTGSFILSASILAVFFALVSWAIYRFAIHRALDQIRTQAATVYEVARLAKAGYEWVVDKIRFFKALHQLFHDR